MDATSASVREGSANNRRGTLVVPAEPKIDRPTFRSGPDEQVPPKGGPDKRVPPGGGGACLSRPMKRDGSSKVVLRTRQARPSSGRRGTPVVPAEPKIDRPTFRGGPDEQVPPKGGPDKRVPPTSGRDERVSPEGTSRRIAIRRQLIAPRSGTYPHTRHGHPVAWIPDKKAKERIERTRRGDLSTLSREAGVVLLS